MLIVFEKLSASKKLNYLYIFLLSKDTDLAIPCKYLMQLTSFH
jgi:hypothetical protein